MAKAQGYDQVLKKHGLKPIGFIKDQVSSIQGAGLELKRRLMCFESKFSKKYFDQVFSLFDTSIKPKGRTTFKAYDGLNNVFNLSYAYLRCFLLGQYTIK